MIKRSLGVGLTPLETRREVVPQIAYRAEQLGYDALYLAEGVGVPRLRAARRGRDRGDSAGCALPVPSPRVNRATPLNN